MWIWLAGCADRDTLAWQDCAPDGFECATFERDGVPIAVARHAAARRSARVAILADGGPGASAIDLLQLVIPAWSGSDPELWDEVTWVAMDNRGVGRTDPITCVDGAWFDDLRALPSIPADDLDADGLRAARDAFQDGCLAERSAEELGELGSPTYADDLDALRAAMGLDEIDFLGFSAGTRVGALLAARHPEHVGRFVLDGVVAPDPDRAAFLTGQAEGFDRALARFFDRCAVDPACPVREDPAGAYDRVLAALPFAADDGRVLTPDELRWGASGLLYGPDDATLAAGLAAADAGDPTVLLAATDAGWGRGADGTYDPIYQRYWAIGCLDFPWPAEWTDEDVWALGATLDEGYPRVGASILTGELACRGWPASADPPSFDAPGAPPLLLVNGAHDPATPLAGALALQDALGNGSEVLTYEGDGHVALFVDPSGCSYLAEREFLLTGATSTLACP